MRDCETRVVAVADMVPSGVNPREDFGDLEALAARFDVGPHPGEPLQHPIVVPDGGVYRIYDGERRWRAMKLRGTETCHVHVCDDAEAAEAVRVALATDDKKPLTDAERDRGVQQVLLLGVAPETVDREAGVSGSRSALGGLERARRAGYARCEDISFEQAKVLDEFADDEEAVAELLALVGDAGKFSARAAWMRNRDQTLAARGELLAELRRLRVPVVDEPDDGGGAVLAKSLTGVDGVEAAVAEACVGHTAVHAVVSDASWSSFWWQQPACRLYGTPMEDARETEAERARREGREKAGRLWEWTPLGGNPAHDLWFDGMLPKLAGKGRGCLAHGAGLCRRVERALDERCHEMLQVEEFAAATDRDFGETSDGLFAEIGAMGWIVGWQLAKPMVSRWEFERICAGEHDSIDPELCAEYTGWLADLEEAGYAPSPAEREVAAAVRACTDAQGGAR